MSTQKIAAYVSVQDAVADTPEEAANLCACAQFMQQIAAIVTESDGKRVQAAGHCDVAKPHI